MTNKRYLIVILSLLLFVGNIFLATLTRENILIHSSLAVLFSIVAIISIIWKKTNKQYDLKGKKIFTIVLAVISTILLLVFSYFTLNDLINGNLLELPNSLLGVVGNISLLVLCLISLYKNHLL